MFAHSSFARMVVTTAIVPLSFVKTSGENPSGLRGRATDSYNHGAVPNAYVLVHRNGVPTLKFALTQ